MGDVVFECPRQKVEVATGLQLEEEDFRRLSPIVRRMTCPACGSDHVWSKGLARVVPGRVFRAQGFRPAPAVPAAESAPVLATIRAHFDKVEAGIRSRAAQFAANLRPRSTDK